MGCILRQIVYRLLRRAHWRLPWMYSSLRNHSFLLIKNFSTCQFQKSLILWETTYSTNRKQTVNVSLWIQLRYKQSQSSDIKILDPMDCELLSTNIMSRSLCLFPLFSCTAPCFASSVYRILTRSLYTLRTHLASKMTVHRIHLNWRFIFSFWVPNDSFIPLDPHKFSVFRAFFLRSFYISENSWSYSAHSLSLVVHFRWIWSKAPE